MSFVPQDYEIPDGLRSFTDFDKARSNIYGSVYENAAAAFPIEGRGVRLELADLQYTGPETFSLAEEKDALLRRRSLYRPLKGTFKLVDAATGAELGQKRGLVARVPYMTRRGTFIRNGLEYTVANQARLLSGVYSRQKESGDMESHFNILGGGPSFRLFMDPDSGVFKMQIGKSKIPLVPLLRAVGVTDAQIKDSWGPKLLQANLKSQGGDEVAVRKAYLRLAQSASRISPDGKPVPLKDILASFKLDTRVTGRTLDQPYDRITPDAILAATRKLLAISRGEADPDDRDSLSFQETYSPEDLFSERIANDAGGVLRKALFKLSATKRLDSLPAGILDRLVDQVFTRSGLASPLEEINPIDPIDQNLRLTRLGEGGIEDKDSIPLESRNVLPSQFMFVDPVRAPESNSVGVDARVTFGALRGKDRRLYTSVRDRKGRDIFVTPEDVADSVVAFPGELRRAAAEGRRKVVAMARGKLGFVDVKDVMYEASRASQVLTLGTNLVPGGGNWIKGGRLLMGAKFSNQALPLDQREAPRVVPVLSDGRPVSEAVSSFLGAARAKQDGVVTDVDAAGVHIRYRDGTKAVEEVYDNFPLNRKTFLSGKPVVVPGQQVRKGQALTASNFTTDDGKSAVGLNMRVGYLPRDNYEDSILISESAAKRLSSQHMFAEKKDFTDFLEASRSKFLALFPKEFTKEQLGKVGDDGVVKKGTIVQQGDPLVLAVERKVSKGGGMLRRGGRGTFTSAASTWDHAFPGEVVDVFTDEDGVKLTVKASVPATVADKLAGFYGDKGVISEVVPDEQMPKDSQGRPLEVLLNPLGVISRGNPMQMYEAVLGKIAEKTGKPYNIKFEDVDRLQDFVEAEMAKHGISDTEAVFDPRSNRRLKDVFVGSRYLLKLYHTAECFDDQTEVLTQRGWVPWPEVTKDDLLGTSDTRGSSLYFEKPYALVSFDYRGALCCYEGKYVDYAVTPNHNLWCKPYYAKSRLFGLRQASEVHGSTFAVKQFGLSVSGEDRDTIKVGPSEYRWVDFCSLVGWWVTEGCVTRQGEPVIYQSQTANPKKVEQIRELLGRMGIPAVDHTVRGVVWGLRLRDKELGAYFKKYGSVAVEKEIPREIFAGGPAGCRAALEAMLDGDGARQRTHTGPSIRFTSISKKLADGFQELAIRSGCGSIVRRDSDTWKKYRDNPHYAVAYCCSFTDTRKQSQVDGYRDGSGFSMREYSGKVYCAEMPSGLLYVRRNGKPMLSGNSKVGSRGIGSYTIDGEPAASDEGNPKRLGWGELVALVSHGATQNIKDTKLIRGNRNDDYWRAIMQGETPNMPNVPNTYRKFISYLAGAGIGVTKKGQSYHLQPLTDKEVDKMSQGEITSPDTVTWLSEYGRGTWGEKSMDPVPGGLFDRGITGGHGGTKFSHLNLAVPIPQPVMAPVVRALLGLTEKQFEAVLRGEEEIGKHGSGPLAIQKALSGMQPALQIPAVRQAVQTARGNKRDQLVKKLKYLSSLQDMGVRPEELVITKLPVIPPVFRPVTTTDKFTMVAGVNKLYANVIELNNAYKALSRKLGPDSAEAKRLQGDLYQAAAAVTGIGDPVRPDLVNQGVKGILRDIVGSSSKYGLFQRRLLGTSVDLAGRAAIRPGYDLDMDHIGIPEDMAWKLYGRFVVNRLARKGGYGSRADAVRAVADRSSLAKKFLLEEMAERPVLATRAPALHRYSVMAFKPVLAAGDAIQISPPVTPGFGADFDGDAMNVHAVPTRRGIEEALSKLLPSKNLRSPSDFDVHYLPRQEYLEGLWRASTASKKRDAHVFSDVAALRAAFARGEVDLGDPVIVLDEKKAV